jgi:preprotein translocase subunit SecY
MRRISVLNLIRRIAHPWRKAAVSVAGILFCIAGVRLGVPGVDGQIVRDFFHGHPGGLLALYDLIVGGAVSRGAILALGIMPYLSARCFLWIARLVSPAVDALPAGEADRYRLARWTPRLTVGLSLIQTYGYARFVQSIPGAVAHPGVEFIARTMLILTGGAIVVSWLSEEMATLNVDDLPIQAHAATHAELASAEEIRLADTPRVAVE